MASARKPRRKRSPLAPGSLLTAESTGGIVAGKGFDFQTRYTACNLPEWLLEEAFHQLFYEGTGDIDLRRSIGGRSVLTHLQVKDHEVGPAEFKKIVAHFRKLDQDLHGAYACFTLVCPSLAAKLRPVESGLSRYRKAKPFYENASDVLAPTKADVDTRIRSIGLTDEAIQFVQEKVHFEIGHGDLHQDERAIDLFVGRLLKHPEYAQHVRAAVQPVYAELLRAIQAKRGAVLDRAEIDGILRDAVAAVRNNEKTITLWVQNWTREKFEPPADYELDWSAHFDRSTRRVPSEDAWNGQLLQQLKSLKETIVAGRTERVIRFRGKCALSTGITLGAAFPAVGGWTFEIPQPPAREPWRSDAKPTHPHDFNVDLTDGGGSGSDLVLGLNIRGDGRDDILRYIAGTNAPPRFFAFMAPSAPGGQSIRGTWGCLRLRAGRTRAPGTDRQEPSTQPHASFLLRTSCAFRFLGTATDLCRAGAAIRISGPGLRAELPDQDVDTRRSHKPNTRLVQLVQ